MSLLLNSEFTNVAREEKSTQMNLMYYTFREFHQACSFQSSKRAKTEQYLIWLPPMGASWCKTENSEV